MSEEILENGRVCGVRVRNVKTQAVKELELSGLFVAVGNVPATEFVRGAVELDAAGYFLAGEDTKTNLPGVFAAGDCRKKPLRQIVTAAADAPSQRTRRRITCPETEVRRLLWKSGRHCTTGIGN